MKHESSSWREELSHYIQQMAADAGVQNYAQVDGISSFPVPLKTHERLVNLVNDQDTTGFLRRVNTPLVAETEGKLLYGDMAEHVLKRSNPPSAARAPSVTASQKARAYKLLSTEADLLLSWDKLNAYARFPNFQATLRTQLATRIANDRLYVGWNGTDDSQAHVDSSNIDALNKGWLQRLRDEKAANVISEIVSDSGKVFVGTRKEVPLETKAVSDASGGKVDLPAAAHGFVVGAQIHIVGTTNYNGRYLVESGSGTNTIRIKAAHNAETLSSGAKAVQDPDYANLDELVVDLVSAIPVHKHAGLTILLPADLRATEKGLLYGQHGSQPSEKVTIERAFSTLAGLPVETPAFLPAQTIVVTAHRNLSLYIHENWHRAVENKQEWKGVVFWNEFTEGYFVEDPEAIIVAEHITRI